MPATHVFRMHVSRRGHYIWTTIMTAAQARRRNQKARARAAAYRWIQEDCQDKPGNVQPLTTGARPGRTGRQGSHPVNRTRTGAA